MSLSPFDSFQSRFVIYLLNFPRKIYFLRQEGRMLLELQSSVGEVCMVRVNVKFTLQQATKTQMGIRGVAVLFL